MTRMTCMETRGAGDDWDEYPAKVLLPDDDTEATLLSTFIVATIGFVESRPLTLFGSGLGQHDGIAWFESYKMECGADGWWQAQLHIRDEVRPTPADVFGRHDNVRAYPIVVRVVENEKGIYLHWRLPMTEYSYASGEDQSNISGYQPVLSSSLAHRWWDIGEMESQEEVIAAGYGRICPGCGKAISWHLAAIRLHGFECVRSHGGDKDTWECKCGGKAVRPKAAA